MSDSALAETDAVELTPAPPSPAPARWQALQRRFARFRPQYERLQRVHWTPIVLFILVAVSLFFRFIWLDKPAGALIFDEKYYVNAVRVILNLPLPDDAPYRDQQRGLDPNTEHPPLAKLLIAASTRLLGDNGFGWRLPSVIIGTLSIPLIFGIVQRAGGSDLVALLATFFYAFDNLVFVHSRIATLDIFFVCFMLLGVYWYLDGHPALAGLALVVATLCKINGMYGLGILVAYEALRLLRDRVATKRWDWRQLRPLAITCIVFVAVYPWLLGLLDNFWGQYKNPLDHLHHIFAYGFALTREGGPQGQESNPWQWLLNDVPMNYLRTDVTVKVGDEIKSVRAIIEFRGAMNPYVIASAPIGIAYAIYLAWKERDDLSFMALALFFVTYGPYWPAAEIGHRISYIYYFLPVIPSVAIAAGQFFAAPWMPRLVRWAFIGAVLLGFYGYFPFRTIP
jgi:predicted membrane-bound dolichyl-phosphate-mannose-protein mannosyltransferase